MHNPLKDSAIEEKIFLCNALSDIRKETIVEYVFNKALLIQILTLKIEQSDQFKKIVGGYSNNTYHYERKNLVLRFPKPHNLRYLYAPDNSIEIHNLSQAKLLNLTPLEIAAYYTKYALLVTRFIPSYQLCSENYFKGEHNNKKKLTEVAYLIKKLHYSNLKFKESNETLFPFINSSSKIFENIYSILTKEDHKILQTLDSIKSSLTQFEIIKRPSHGDLHHFNLIEINEAIQLIDWESSSVKDPAYDISRFLCSAELNSEAEDLFLQTYKSSLNIRLPDDEFTYLKTRIQLIKPLIYFSTVVWAKYTIHFHCDKKRLFEEVIKTLTEKTLTSLEKIQLPVNSTAGSTEKTKTYSQSYTSLFDITLKSEPTLALDQSATNSQTYFKKTK